MRYLVDTDWVVDWLKGKAAAFELLKSLSDEGLAISLITYGEIYEGVYYGHNPAAQEEIFLDFLQLVEVLPLNRSTMKRFARLRGELRRKGALIDDPDLLIAATALEYYLILVTRNRSHFERVPGLELYGEEK